MGGPASYTDAQIEAAHSHLDIATPHFDTLKDIINDVLNDFGVDSDDITTILGAFESRRGLLLKA